MKSLARFARTFGVGVLAALLFVAPCRAAETGSPAQQAGPILTAKSFWRWHLSWSRPAVASGGPAAAGKATTQPVFLPAVWSGTLRSGALTNGWAGRDFDDTGWPRSRGPFPPGGAPHQAGVVSVRGRFTVTDPSAVGPLTLELAYRGGAVVYLNGQEVARRHLPPGPLSGAARGEPYDDRAWVDAAGKPIPYAYHVNRRVKAGEKDLGLRVASRTRRLGPLRLPEKLLVKGVNVLAIAVHRGDYHPLAVKWFQRGQKAGEPWVPLDITDVRLHAAGPGAVPNVAPAGGVRVWNVDIHQRLRFGDHGDANEPLGPIRIVAARNGAFSGAVAVESDGPLRDLRARLTDLAQANGAGKIPASAAEVLYVLPGKINRIKSHYEDWAYDVLSPRPPDQVLPPKPAARGGRGPQPKPVALLPVWVKLHVPADAAAGEYRGALRLSAEGAEEVGVPVHLHVSEASLPEPRQFRSYVGMYQSPTSLAMQYKVPEWSEKHWRLMDASFAMLGQVGNKLVNILVVDQTQFGNESGMVTWVRQQDGSFEHDFSVVERYLELVRKHLGAVPFAAVHVWHAAGWNTRPADQKNTVTVIDKATGNREHMQVPVFGTPESRRFWAPVLEGIRERLARVGMERSMCLGILSDGTAPPEVLAQFAQMLPGVGWLRGAHRQTWATGPVKLRGGGKVVLWEFVYGLSVADPAARLHPIWRHTGPGVAFLRKDFDNLPLMGFRTSVARAMLSRTRGVGRLCLDFFLFPIGKYRHCSIYNRYPDSSVAQRQPTMCHLAHPGPDGPQPTVRFELFREGLQEAEVLIRLTEARARHAEKLSEGLAEAARQVVFEQVNTAHRVHHFGAAAQMLYTGWQDRAARLYRTWAEVAEALEGP